MIQVTLRRDHCRFLNAHTQPGDAVPDYVRQGSQHEGVITPDVDAERADSSSGRQQASSQRGRGMPSPPADGGAVSFVRVDPYTGKTHEGGECPNRVPHSL